MKAFLVAFLVTGGIIVAIGALSMITPPPKPPAASRPAAPQPAASAPAPVGWEVLKKKPPVERKPARPHVQVLRGFEEFTSLSAASSNAPGPGRDRYPESPVLWDGDEVIILDHSQSWTKVRAASQDRSQQPVWVRNEFVREEPLRWQPLPPSLP
jgi:hypothetical protein